MSTVIGTFVDIVTADGTADAYVSRPDDGRAHPGVLMYQDAFGVRPHLRAMADRLAASGYTVLVPNVFYRHGRTPVVELPEFIDMASRPDIVEKVVPLMEALTPELAERDAGAYLGWFGRSPLVTDGPVGITGYCMGARLALYTAGTHPDRVAAVAGFHGGDLASEAPDSPHLLAGRITAELYFAHADEDPSMSEEQVRRLEKALADAGVDHRCEVYEGAHHGYTQSDTAAYDPAAAERHWTELLALFGRVLR
ncbi:dienelactone hydrolase family protein [Streptomyces sp. YU58]|uniref:dienelactone hydrolase family protein n=1 Tax=Streptomyces sp. SX92 TaxID=3158972 RepID=UPI0027BAC88C|nr:dienelactone hydrolase family protein [Streptomyces coralus]WLW58132.1 dienelactone hydrolase family protein [Streptomyces coralus]